MTFLFPNVTNKFLSYKKNPLICFNFVDTLWLKFNYFNVEQ